jgi:multimeric flavodoxin WrbA
MKALLINGSPHQKGCTYTALQQVEQGLGESGVEAEYFWIGKAAVRPCIACRECARLKRCAFEDDVVNRLVAAATAADALVIGSPVYYAGMQGSLKSVCDRLWYCAGAALAGKPAAAVTSARRAGTTTTLEQIYKYFMIDQMPVASSSYWPMVHGNSPEEVLQDEEGINVCRQLGINLADLMRCQEAGRAVGIERKQLSAVKTNFIR